MGDLKREWLDVMYREYWKPTYIVAYHLIGDPVLAEDFAQEAFAVLTRKYDEVRDHPNIKRWLARTTANLIANESRKAYHSREVALKPEDVPTVEDTYFQDLASVLPPGLSEKDRELLSLCYESGLSQEEIAARLGCTVTALRMRLSRAKARYEKLREKIPPHSVTSGRSRHI